jgi:hypothetical protein
MIAIVAIPSEDDYVWKVSSQKIPHLTLMVLGESVDNISGVAEFLEHVVDTSMRRFGLQVDRRGELGEDPADVLFFGKYGVRRLEEIRTYLLTNEDINRAYHSIPQFPEWTPHLTLGYPDDPAKPDTRDYPGFSWMNFDTVALWTGDFEGPEFPLKDQDAISEELSMGDRTVEGILAHFGVKGMRWGVRRSRSQLDGGSDDHKNAVAARTKAKKGGTKSLSNKELQDLINRMNLEQQYKRVVPPSAGKRILSGGARFAGEVLAGVGKQQVTKLASDQATRLVGQVLKK